MQVDAFQPTIAGSVVLSVTNTSQKVTLPAGSYIEIQVPTASTTTAFFEQDTSANNPTANTTTSYPVMAGQAKLIRRQPGVTVLAYIGTVAGPNTVYISCGEGV
jgi:hypothetical protein